MYIDLCKTCKQIFEGCELCSNSLDSCESCSVGFTLVTDSVSNLVSCKLCEKQYPGCMYTVLKHQFFVWEMRDWCNWKPIIFADWWISKDIMFSLYDDQVKKDSYTGTVGYEWLKIIFFFFKCFYFDLIKRVFCKRCIQIVKFCENLQSILRFMSDLHGLLHSCVRFD